jgi:hypothetical protein
MRNYATGKTAVPGQHVTLLGPPERSGRCRRGVATTLEQRDGRRTDPPIAASQRQMYGRAGFDLLRLRVLNHA